MRREKWEVGLALREIAPPTLSGWWSVNFSLNGLNFHFSRFLFYEIRFERWENSNLVPLTIFRILSRNGRSSFTDFLVKILLECEKKKKKKRFSTLSEGDWVPVNLGCVWRLWFGVGMGATNIEKKTNPEDPLVRGMGTRESRRKARLTARCFLPDSVCVCVCPICVPLEQVHLSFKEKGDDLTHTHEHGTNFFRRWPFNSFCSFFLFSTPSSHPKHKREDRQLNGRENS